MFNPTEAIINAILYVIWMCIICTLILFPVITLFLGTPFLSWNFAGSILATAVGALCLTVTYDMQKPEKKTQ